MYHTLIRYPAHIASYRSDQENNKAWQPMIPPRQASYITSIALHLTKLWVLHAAQQEVLTSPAATSWARGKSDDCRKPNPNCRPTRQKERGVDTCDMV